MNHLLLLLPLIVNAAFIFISCDTHVNLTSLSGRCVRTGQKLLLTCSLHGDAGADGELFFKRGKTRLISSERRLITEGITTSSLVVPEADSNDEGAYVCCRGQCSRPNEFDNGIFEIGDIPPEPLHFHCIISLSRVNCYFSVHDSCVEWTLHYHLSGEEDRLFHGNCSGTLRKSPQCVDVEDKDHSYRNLMRKCRDSHREEIMATCPLSDAVRDEVYWVQLEGRSPYGTSWYFYNVTTNISIERLGPLRNFRVESTTSTSVSLAWYFPNNPAYYLEGISCYIEYQTSNNTTQNQTKLWKTGKNVRYSLLNLKPYRNYTVDVSCHFTASRYWSKNHTVRCTTKQDAPMYGPNATLTSYTVYKNANKTYTVAIYIKPPSPDSINGILLGYELQLFSSPDHNDNVTVMEYSVSSTLIVDNVPPGTKELFTDIKSLTVAGRSRDSLRLNISMEQTTNDDLLRVKAVAVNEYPDHQHFLVRIQHNTQASSDSKDVTYIYHWCQTDVGDYDCYDRKLVQCLANYDFAYSMQTQRTIVVKKSPARNYSWVFGASIAFPVTREGLTWGTCTLPYGWINNSTTYTVENTVSEQLPGLIAVPLCLAAGLIMIAVYFIWKRYRHVCNAYEVDTPSIENDDGGLCSTNTISLHQPSGDKTSDQPENAETEEIRNSEYSRLHPDDNADIEGSGVVSDQESSPFMDPNRDHVDGEASCREKYDNGNERDKTDINNLNEPLKILSDWTICQVQKEEKVKILHLSNYTEGLPGDTPRAVSQTHDVEAGKTFELRCTTDDFERRSLTSEDDGSRAPHVPLPADHIPPADQLGAEELETELIGGNIEYSRLHPVNSTIPGDNTTGSSQEQNSNDGLVSDLECMFNENDVQDLDKERKTKNQRNRSSNYVLNIPGDIPRAVLNTQDKQTSEGYRHHRATDETSKLQTEEETTCSPDVLSIHPLSDYNVVDQVSTREIEVEKICKNAKYSRLPPVYFGKLEDSATMSGKEQCPLESFDRDLNCLSGKTGSTVYDTHREQITWNPINHCDESVISLPPQKSVHDQGQGQKRNNQRNKLSNYVLNIPGDVARAVCDKHDRQTIEGCRHHRATDRTSRLETIDSKKLQNYTEQTMRMNISHVNESLKNFARQTDVIYQGQKQILKNERRDMSNYVLTIPGDTRRAVRESPDNTSCKDFQHLSAANELGLSGYHTENGDLCKKYIPLKCKSTDEKGGIHCGTGILEPHEIKNSDNFCLPPGSELQVFNRLRNLTKKMDNSVIEVVSSASGENEEKNDENFNNHYDNYGKNDSEYTCSSSHEHDLKKDNKRNNLSKYVPNVPGDTVRAATRSDKTNYNEHEEGILVTALHVQTCVRRK